MIHPLQQIQQAISQGKVGGSWLITGGYDYEKKLFVKRICATLLNQDLNVFDGFSPDVKWIECGLTDEAKKEIQKTILAGKSLDTDKEFSRRREITVEDIRDAIQFLSLKGTENRWRILIINPADKMNESASNALLKMLEEPPAYSVIFLLCQNLGKLLPTIKSRCRKLVVPPENAAELKQKLQQAYPELTQTDEVISLSQGSFGLAREICDNDGLSLYQQILSFCRPANQVPVESVSDFAASLSPNAYALVKLFILNWISDQAKANALTNPFVAEDWMDLYQESARLFADVDRIYLDKKQVLQTLIFKIAGFIHD